MTINQADLAHRFGYHPPPDQNTIDHHQEVRKWCFDTAQALVELTKPSREQSLAITAMEEAMMWANAAIARHGPPDPPTGDDEGACDHTSTMFYQGDTTCCDCGALISRQVGYDPRP